MNDIAIGLTAAELQRLEQVATLHGMTVGELVTAALRARYALRSGPSNVVPLPHKPASVPGGKP